MTIHITIDRDRLQEFSERWQVTELAVFGSALREDFPPDSDLDVLVTFAPEARHTLFDLVEMSEDLSQIIGRRVDLVSRRGIERSLNSRRRREILESAQTIHVA